MTRMMALALCTLLACGGDPFGGSVVSAEAGDVDATDAATDAPEELAVDVGGPADADADADACATYPPGTPVLCKASAQTYNLGDRPHVFVRSMSGADYCGIGTTPIACQCLETYTCACVLAHVALQKPDGGACWCDDSNGQVQLWCY
jgi:hypothetical protein